MSVTICCKIFDYCDINEGRASIDFSFGIIFSYRSPGVDCVIVSEFAEKGLGLSPFLVLSSLISDHPLEFGSKNGFIIKRSNVQLVTAFLLSFLVFVLDTAIEARAPLDFLQGIRNALRNYDNYCNMGPSGHSN